MRDIIITRHVYKNKLKHTRILITKLIK